MDCQKKGTNKSGAIPLKTGTQEREPPYDHKWHDTRTNDKVHKVDRIPTRGSH